MTCAIVSRSDSLVCYSIYRPFPAYAGHIFSLANFLQCSVNISYFPRAALVSFVSSSLRGLASEKRQELGPGWINGVTTGPSFVSFSWGYHGGNKGFLSCCMEHIL